MRGVRSAATGLVAIGMLVDPSRPLPFEICLWKRLFDLECLTCGLTRAVCSALQFDFTGSWGYHPAGVFVAAALVVIALRQSCSTGGRRTRTPGDGKRTPGVLIPSVPPSAAAAPPVLRG